MAAANHGAGVPGPDDPRRHLIRAELVHVDNVVRHLGIERATDGVEPA
jgi:hypothetical protein